MHKKIGIIGGLTPESTVSYYLHITRSYVEKFGDYGYPEIIIYSVNLENYHQWRTEDKWNLIIDDLVLAAKKLENAGADFGLIATNTMHKVFDEVQSKIKLPLIHIIDSTIAEIKKSSLTKIGLLGTTYTMREDFYKKRLHQNDIEVIVPELNDQEIVFDIIMNELARGIIKEESLEKYLAIKKKLEDNGAQGIVLGCTEIPLLVKQEHCKLPIFDTAIIHAEAALEYSLTK